MPPKMKVRANNSKSNGPVTRVNPVSRLYRHLSLRHRTYRDACLSFLIGYHQVSQSTASLKRLRPSAKPSKLFQICRSQSPWTSSMLYRHSQLKLRLQRPLTSTGPTNTPGSTAKPPVWSNNLHSEGSFPCLSSTPVPLAFANQAKRELET